MTLTLPLLTDLEPEQMDVYVHPANSSIVVVGPPGSGKTSLAIWRSLFIANNGQQVVLLTKNRALAGLAHQLALEGQGGNIATETMHRFVWHHYLDTFGRPHTRGQGDYQLRWDEILHDYAARNVQPHIDHVVVDEGQNLPPEFFIWAKRHCAKTLSIFADEHQTTVDSGSTMADIMHLGIQDMFRLVYNHRNSAEIAALSNQFHRGRRLPAAIAKRGLRGNVPKVEYIANWYDLARLVGNRLANAGGSVGVITYNIDDVNAVYATLLETLPRTRVDLFHSKLERGAELVRMRDPGVTVLSGESAIGLEFDAVYLHDLSRSLPMVYEMDHRRLYMLTARARDLLVLVNGPHPLIEAQLNGLPTAPYLIR